MHPYTQEYRPKIRKKPKARKFIKKYLVKNFANEHVRAEKFRPRNGIREEGGEDETVVQSISAGVVLVDHHIPVGLDERCSKGQYS